MRLEIMSSDKRYISSIPSTATEHILERYSDGTRKKAEYHIDGKVVGVRYWQDDKIMDIEKPYKNGLLHGTYYEWYFEGRLTAATPYHEGKIHGVAKQWSDSGKLVGTYKMVHGTGIDLWWNIRWGNDGSNEGHCLSEVYYMKDGLHDGFTWIMNGDQATIAMEEHYIQDVLHGIKRWWNSAGRLCREFPQYYVNGDKLNKRQYIRAAALDETLPPFRIEDNNPARIFPNEICKHLVTE